MDTQLTRMTFNRLVCKIEKSKYLELFYVIVLRKLFFESYFIKCKIPLVWMYTFHKLFLLAFILAEGLQLQKNMLLK